ncbi:putative methyltransferase PMT21 [Bienertia sinuspersici]
MQLEERVQIPEGFEFDICRHYYGEKDIYEGFDVKALSDRIEEVLEKMENLQNKLEEYVQKMEKDKDQLEKSNISRLEFKSYLDDEVVQPLYAAHIALRQIRLPKPEDLEEYMDYDVGSYCKDDWNLAQKLMLHGCDPLPRRRCLTRASKLSLKPYPINESLWKIPDARNVRWNLYKCSAYDCLSSNNTNRGYTKCTGCFEMGKEMLKWVNKSVLPPSDFLITDVLAIKPGEIRIGIDYSVGTGSFAARMKEQNVTIISTALNLGAPFSETIALRGLLPLYVTPNQRLPFFENSMDLIHTTGLLDGWIDLLLLDFMLFDWDRVLRPGGLLWIDKFFCNRTDIDDYMYMFLQFRYKKHKWVVTPKSKDEVYLSALLEKPPRSL